MSVLGILAVRMIEGSFTAKSFRDFIDLLLTQMNPYPGPNSVILMDNCPIHRCPETLEMIEARGMRFLFTPPYSLDCNPIELAFSKIKNSIRRDGEAVRVRMLAASAERPRVAVDYIDPGVLAKLYEHVYSVTPEDAKGWFKHCDYVVE
ncbi:hypothetical protein FRC07_009135 [Ceratobasidium sp. 392]|nr:hypothetical protein FRC07_009135 [Ceratobasidium sp. 392]